MLKRILLYFIFLLFTCQPLLAQIPVTKDTTKIGSKRDTIIVDTKKDTTKVYRNLERYSKKRKFTKFVHKLIFRPAEKTPPQKKKRQSRAQKNMYTASEGKIIRNIDIVTLDPFGYSIDNPKKVPKQWIEKTGNAAHAKSKKWAIRNHLLFKKNEPLDSLLVAESERLIQRERYIRDVIIKPIPIEGSKDSVDISITVLDSWSLIPTGNITSSKGNIELTERNFFGMGHFFENNFKQRFTDNSDAYGVRYIIPNFKNTYISTGFLYDTDFDNNYVLGGSVDRNFFSPLTRWAGGAAFEHRFYRDSLRDAANVAAYKDLKLETQDYWGGHSFRIFKGNTENERITNLVTTFRYRNINYLQKPGPVYDSISFFNDSKLYLTSIGITSRRFVENRYLFNNGIREYVQIGKTFSVTAGFEEKNRTRRPYFGGRIAQGGLYEFGYLGASIEIGSFFNKGTSEQSTFRAEALYFTDLLEIGKWNVRQFIKPQLTIGTNRLPTESDLISLGNDTGIQGFEDNVLGTKKLLLTFQTQTYVPGRYYGFRLSPFANVAFGMMADNGHKLFESKLYSKFGLGILISNDYLVFNSFLLSLAYYPTIPDMGHNLFKTNTFKNSDLDLLDYQIGKPITVPYQ